MNRFKRLVGEIHRRSLWQVLSIYLVASWVGYEVASELTQGLGLPSWVPGFAVVLFVIGLPIVLATAFIQEGGPTRRQPDFTPHDPTLFADTFAPEPPSPAHALFTWKRAIGAGAIAFLLLGITAAGYMGMRNAGIGPFGSLLAKGTLDERERVLIAEFNDVTGDTMLAQAVTQAFRVSFSQSNVVTVVEPAYVRAVLARMERPASTRMDADLAREVALRDNIKAYVTGDIARIGGRYSLSGKLLSSDDASVLATYQEGAADSTEILTAVDQLSRKLREKIGESLRTVRADRPLAAVTTPSLSALRKYTQAEHAADVADDLDRAISLLKEAVTIDSTFAMAWRKLAVIHSNRGAPFDLVMHAATKAYDHRDRLPDLERYLTIAFYQSNVTEDMNLARDAYLNALEIQPTNYIALNNLGIIYQRLRDHQRARELYEKSIASDDSKRPSAYSNLVTTLLTLGETDSAAAVVENIRRTFGEGTSYFIVQSELDAVKGDYAAIEQRIRKQLAAQPAGGGRLRAARMPLAASIAVRGRIAEAERVIAEFVQLEREHGTERALDFELGVAELYFRVRQDPVLASRRLDEAMRQTPIEGLPIASRPYVQLASVQAMLGRADRARVSLASHERLPREIRGDDRDRVSQAQGWIALAEKRYADAIESFRVATSLGECARCDHSELALAFEAVEQPDSAIAHYEYWLNTPHPDSQLFDNVSRLGPVYERLADLYERRGDTQKAAYYAGKFVELWQVADAHLQPRVQAKRALLQRLAADRR